jgi:alkanesulfonate monooxygenase SsuD/methylene tetrahydromethanopterin reductase-like flavin-dependent oxidoreductase (luciferase family)
VRFDGEFYRIPDALIDPKPVQRPHPPIYVGGGRGAFPRVAEFGDAWLANSVPPEELGPQIEELRAMAGREVPVTVYGAADDPAAIEGYTRLDVERVLLYLPTKPEKETLDQLDRLAELAARFR